MALEIEERWDYAVLGADLDLDPPELMGSCYDQARVRRVTAALSRALATIRHALPESWQRLEAEKKLYEAKTWAEQAHRYSCPWIPTPEDQP